MTYGIVVAILILALLATLFAVVIENPNPETADPESKMPIEPTSPVWVAPVVQAVVAEPSEGESGPGSPVVEVIPDIEFTDPQIDNPVLAESEPIVIPAEPIEQPLANAPIANEDVAADEPGPSEPSEETDRDTRTIRI